MSTILVAEPDNDVRKLVKTILERNGHTVYAFTSASHALHFLEENSKNVLTKALVPKPGEPCSFTEHSHKNSATECLVEVVILDIDSCTFPIHVIVAKIQHSYPDIASIITHASGYEPIEEIPVEILPKPFGPEELISAIRSSTTH